MKKVMVYGSGMSGLGAKKLLERQNYEVILVDDKKAISSVEAEKYLDEIDFFIKSPGILYNEFMKKVKNKNIRIIDEVELAYEYMLENNYKTKIIAITGTNGKSTTTAKISDLLNFAGYKAKYAGNIGVSFSETILNDKDLDFISLELSSFQLENLEKFKPYISMIINLGPDHIERYKSFGEYYDTKLNIAKNQNSKCYFIQNIDDIEINKRVSKIKTNILTLSKKESADVSVQEEKIYFKGNYVANSNDFSLKGSHNLENMMFIIGVAKIIGISNEKIEAFLKIATPLEHRTEKFFNYGKIKFINDSKATNIDSTTVALNTYKNCILICGGYDKGVDLKPLAKLILENVKEVYLIGVIADKIKKLLLEINYDESKIYNLNDIESSLLYLKKKLNKNSDEIILLSPATSSYDQFNSFEHRGKVFKELVLKIFG